MRNIHGNTDKGLFSLSLIGGWSPNALVWNSRLSQSDKAGKIEKEFYTRSKDSEVEVLSVKNVHCFSKSCQRLFTEQT